MTKIIAANIIFHTYFAVRRRCLIWMIIRSTDSTISFSVVVKVPAYHPSNPGSIPASVIFLQSFFIFFFFFFFFFFFLVLRPVNIISLILSQIVRSGDEPREKPPDRPQVERLVSHVTRDRLESSVVSCF